MTPEKLVCIDCKFFNIGIACKAFPKGIPDEIISGDNDHTKPLKGQENNIVFEPIKEQK